MAFVDQRRATIVKSIAVRSVRSMDIRMTEWVPRSHRNSARPGDSGLLGCTSRGTKWRRRISTSYSQSPSQLDSAAADL